MLLKSGITVAFFTLLSRISGLARELFIAATFGTGFIADAVNVAFKLPNLFRRIFGEGALSSVFIPMFSKKFHESKDVANDFSGKIFTLLLLALIILTLILQLLMPYLMIVLAPGFYKDIEKFNITVSLCRITIPYVIFISITALFGGMLNSVKKFSAGAFAPIIMNICVITITPLIEKDYTAHFGIAYSLIIAGILQVLFMYYFLIKNKLKFPLLFQPKDQEVSTLLKKMGPAVMSSGAQQINLFISQTIASFIPGAISVLAYADRLYQFPLSLIGITFGTILLPELSRIYKQKQYSEANILQNNSIRISSIIAIPAMVGLFILAHPIIHFIYERGEFSSNDTEQTAAVLMGFSLGLPAFVMSKILTPIFYANLDTATPFKITLYSIIANIILNIILMLVFGSAGIALGSSIAAWFNVYLLNHHAKKYGESQINAETKLYLLKIIICSIFMGIFISLIMYEFNSFFYLDNFLIKTITLFGTITGSVGIYVIFCYFFKIHNILNQK